MSVYNGDKYISEAIDSLVKQDFPQEKYFILVIDDGSLDETPSILNSYREIDNFTFVRNEKNMGLAISLNKALSLIACKFILRFDADDIAMPNLLSALYNDIDGYAFCHPYMYIFYNNRRDEKVEYKVSSLASFFASGVLFRDDVISKYTYSNLFWEEFDLYFRILEEKKKYKISPKPLLYHRVHSKNITKNKDKLVNGYSELRKKWGKEIFKKYNFTLENLLKFYNYYFQER